MKNLLVLPIVYLATASFAAFTIIVKPIVKKYKKRPKADLAKMQRSFYLSRR